MQFVIPSHKIIYISLFGCLNLHCFDPVLCISHLKVYLVWFF